MGQRNGPWTILASETRYRDDFIEVVRDEVLRPDGQAGSYATVSMRPGAAVLVLDEDGGVVLTRQFRYGIGRESIEAASGGVDEGEEPAEAARREIREELGVAAEEWISMGRIDPDTSIVRSPVHLFVARGLTWTEPEQEGTETIQILRMTFSEAVAMVGDGRITHAPTCILLLKARDLPWVSRPAPPASPGP